jgi:ABC-type transport system involved in cytochrome bd biosynthesis fused ATPase/permease subunit
MNALSRAVKNRTSICIAHRLSTVVDADEIFVLDDGRLVESGSHTTLVSNPSSFYAKLWHKQHQVDREMRVTAQLLMENASINSTSIPKPTST